MLSPWLNHGVGLGLSVPTALDSTFALSVPAPLRMAKSVFAAAPGSGATGVEELPCLGGPLRCSDSSEMTYDDFPMTSQFRSVHQLLAVEAATWRLPMSRYGFDVGVFFYLPPCETCPPDSLGIRRFESVIISLAGLCGLAPSAFLA